MKNKYKCNKLYSILEDDTYMEKSNRVVLAEIQRGVENDYNFKYGLQYIE